MAKKVVKKVVKKSVKKKVVKPKEGVFRQALYSKDIRAAREKLGFTLRAAAQATNLPITTLHWMEKGKHAPNVEAFARTVSFYNLKPVVYIR